ncbi:UNVERIFIED_CONTAM: hypothetical protein GTU68_037707 [Idotea baltica]|nr:hypothetical protein [Idotea baltica]
MHVTNTRSGRTSACWTLLNPPRRPSMR